jgi:hypothetical protein
MLSELLTRARRDNQVDSVMASFKRRVAVAFFCLIFPWQAVGEEGEEGAKSLSLLAETPRCSHGCCFGSTVQLEGEALSLRGLSTFRYWGFRVYTGALYLPIAIKTREAARGEIRKKLVLCYHRSLSPDQFRDKSLEVLDDTPEINLTTLEPFLSAINNAYVAVQEGDRYAITYTPAAGTLKLLFNEREPALVTIQSPAFAKAYFGIWISEYSVGRDFTAELFGEKGLE